MSNADLIRRLRECGAGLCTENPQNYLAGLSVADAHQAADALEAHEWNTDMNAAPRDGTPVVVIGRYRDATAGFPRHAMVVNNRWQECTRNGDDLIVWAWHPRDESWPAEPAPPDNRTGKE